MTRPYNRRPDQQRLEALKAQILSLKGAHFKRYDKISALEKKVKTLEERLAAHPAESATT